MTSSWWKTKYGKNSLCGITRSRLRAGKNKNGLSHVVFLNCKHGFYRNALSAWVLTKPHQDPTCPLCRKEFDPLKAFT
jgi:hypothetical protein